MAESEYAGYARKGGKETNAQAAKRVFDRDYEGMRTAYETYKRSDEPSSAEMSKRLGRGEEKAAKIIARTGRSSDQEEKRERRRGRRS